VAGCLRLGRAVWLTTWGCGAGLWLPRGYECNQSSCHIAGQGMGRGAASTITRAKKQRNAIIDHPTVEDRDARRLRWHGPSAGCELVSCCPRATKGGVRQDSSLQNTTCDKRSCDPLIFWPMSHGGPWAAMTVRGACKTPPDTTERLFRRSIANACMFACHPLRGHVRSTQWIGGPCLAEMISKKKKKEAC
jgi:hypothetical protein